MARNKKAGLLHGVGISNNDYPIKKGVHWRDENGRKRYTSTWECPYHARWSGMIKRCYSEKSLAKRPYYRGCSVSDEFLDFMKFKAWMETQEWEGMELDKDILFEGNRVYSRETCVFVPENINHFFTDSAKARGKYPIGVHQRTGRANFIVQCKDGSLGKNKQINLGEYSCPEQAHLVWKLFKCNVGYRLSKEVSDPRVAKALRERYLLTEDEKNNLPAMKQRVLDLIERVKYENIVG